MTGLHDLDQGIGLDVVPSASATKSRVVATDTHDTNFEPSLDVAYKITPSLNGLLTINTDFAATEVDDRQVNLTRFGLFFPEKRDFFLREADIFEFGRIGANDGNGSVSGAEKQNARPFFSRRIGLDAAGLPVDLDYGGKVSGRIGRFELGALSIRQDQHGAVDATTLSVVRAKAGIGEESTVGAILTNGTRSRTSTIRSRAPTSCIETRICEAGARWKRSLGINRRTPTGAAAITAPRASASRFPATRSFAAGSPFARWRRTSIPRSAS
jgi:hypothetical protein